MPRTTEYRHTRQDRWMQTELVSALAENATKLNPFEIIPLQTTRKENNWKTKEMLERAVVTLETERIKESDPWCSCWWLWLWWWWWWFCHYRPQGRRTIGRLKKCWLSSCNFGGGTDQRVRSFMFMLMMMMMMMMILNCFFFLFL